MDYGLLPRFPGGAEGGDSGAELVRAADRRDRTWEWVAVALVTVVGAALLVAAAVGAAGAAVGGLAG